MILIKHMSITLILANGQKLVREVVQFGSRAFKQKNRQILMLESPLQRAQVAVPLAAHLRDLAKKTERNSSMNATLREAAWAYENAASAPTDLDARIAIARAARLIG